MSRAVRADELCVSSSPVQSSPVPTDNHCRKPPLRVIAATGFAVLVVAAALAVASQLVESAGVLDWLRSIPWPVASPLAALMICCAVPTPLVTTVLGITYGPVAGSTMALAAVVLAAAIKLVILRRCPSERAEAALDRYSSVRHYLRNSAFSAIFVARIAGSPLIALAALGAIGNMGARTFLSAIALASAPKTIAYATFGGSLDHMPIGLVAVGAATLAGISVLIARRARRNAPAADTAAAVA